MVDSASNTPTMKIAITLSHGRLIQGPNTSGSLHSSSAKTVALGSRMPASTCTAVVISPSGAFGMRTTLAASRTIAV